MLRPGSRYRTVSICENGQKRAAPDLTSYPPLTARCTTFDGQPGLEGVLELARADRSERQPARERQPSSARHDSRHDFVANGHLEVALVILQFLDVDDGFALASDIDERRFRTDGDDHTLDGLTPLELPQSFRGFEHRCEIFLVGLGHLDAPCNLLSYETFAVDRRAASRRPHDYGPAIRPADRQV